MILNMNVRRSVDIAISIVLLLALSPLMLMISVAILMTMGAPVVFRQKRPGWRGKTLDMLKFRTMTDCKDETGQLLPDSERTNALGQFLRDTSLDELPQLINVILGDMSLVGPRPIMQRFVDDCTPEQLRRYDVRPGITGWAQVHGRKSLDYGKRFEFDVWYVDHQSLLLDLRILLATFFVVLRRDGIVEAGEIAPEPARIHPWPAERVDVSARVPELSRQVERAKSPQLQETATL